MDRVQRGESSNFWPSFVPLTNAVIGASDSDISTGLLVTEEPYYGDSDADIELPPLENNSFRDSSSELIAQRTALLSTHFLPGADFKELGEAHFLLSSSAVQQSTRLEPQYEWALYEEMCNERVKRYDKIAEKRYALLQLFWERQLFGFQAMPLMRNRYLLNKACALAGGASRPQLLAIERYFDLLELVSCEQQENEPLALLLFEAEILPFIQAVRSTIETLDRSAQIPLSLWVDWLQKRLGEKLAGWKPASVLEQARLTFCKIYYGQIFLPALLKHELMPEAARGSALPLEAHMHEIIKLQEEQFEAEAAYIAEKRRWGENSIDFFVRLAESFVAGYKAQTDKIIQLLQPKRLCLRIAKQTQASIPAFLLYPLERLYHPQLQIPANLLERRIVVYGSNLPQPLAYFLRASSGRSAFVGG